MNPDTPSSNRHCFFSRSLLLSNCSAILRSAGALPLVLALFVLLAATPAQSSTAKPLAADLVEDGQAIDLSSERYHALFKELQDKHQFSQEELATLFNGVSINKRVLELMDPSMGSETLLQIQTALHHRNYHRQRQKETERS